MPGLRQRIACFFGRHSGERVTVYPYPFPDAHNCTRCGRLLFMIDNHVVYTVNGRQHKGGVRYRNLEQWMEERG